MSKVRLGDVCKITMGQSPDSSTYNDDGIGVPFYQGNADFGKLHPTAVHWCTEPKKTADNGDILISVRAPIGALNIANEHCCIGRGLASIAVNEDIAERDYIWYLLNSKNSYFQSKGTGSTFKAINKNVLFELPVDLPSKYEQKRISDLLSKSFELTTRYNNKLIKLDELIKSRFVEMFGDINTNDKGWDAQPLGELCSIVRGGSPRPIEQFLGGDVPWIKIGDATEGESIYLNSTKEHIIKEGVKRSRLVRNGSLIFANCGVSLGFARIITFDGCIHDGWLAMENIDARLNKVFLLQVLNQMTDHFRSIAPAGTQPNLNTAIMKAYRQIIPPMELQKRFISFVSQVEKQKATVKKSIYKLETLKKSLMQEYFG